VQVFVRAGSLLIGDRAATTNAFVVVPAGGVLPEISVETSAELIVIVDHSAPPEAVSSGDDARVTPNVYAIEPIVPVIDGRRLAGFERRVLWLDDRTGADTRLLRIPADFSGPGPAWHPVNEEIFCLAGEIQPARDVTMSPGSFLWNPARVIHGYHEYTAQGCVLLEWHDGSWDLVRAEAP
jgi:hypothetical protein